MTDSRSYVTSVRADGSLRVCGSHRLRSTAEHTAATLSRLTGITYVVPRAAWWVRLLTPAGNIDRPETDGTAAPALVSEYSDAGRVRAKHGGAVSGVELWQRDARGAERALTHVEL